MIAVLIAIKEGNTALTLERDLKALGYRVCNRVADGKALREEAELCVPDLILLERELLEDAFWCDAMKSLMEERDIPVIIVDSSPEEKTIHYLKEWKSYGFLKKPVFKRELFLVVELALHRHRIESELKANENLYHSTVENMGGAVITTDPGGRILFLNHAAATLIGSFQKEVEGTPIEEVVFLRNRETDEIINNPVYEAMASDRIVSPSGFSVLRVRSGRERVVIESASPLKNAGGAIGGAVLILQDVTEKLQIHRALEMSEHRYRAIIESTGEGFWLMNEKGVVVDVNRALCQMLGYEFDEIIGKIPDDFLADSTRILLNDSLEGEQRELELRFLRKDGAILHMLYEETRVRDEEEEVLHSFAFMMDISRRRQAEDHLRESEERYRAIFENNSLLQFLVDPNTGLVEDTNPSLVLYFNRKRSEIRGDSLASLFLMDFRVIKEDLSIATEGVKDNFVYRIRNGTGDTREVEIYYTPVEMRGKRYLHGIMHDVTESRTVERALRESEAKFMAMADLTYDWEYWIGPDRKYKFVSLSFHRITGYEIQDLINDPLLFEKITHPEDRNRIVDHFHNDFEKRETCSFDFRITTKSGRIRWINHTCQPVLSESGEQMGRRANNRDITESKQKEEELYLAMKIFDSTVEGVMITDPDQKILMTNPAFTTVTGYSREEVAGKTPKVLNSGRHDRLFFQNMWRALRENDEWEGEIWNRRKNGEIYPEWLHILVIRDEKSRIKNFAAIFIDLTTRKQAEKRLNYLANHDALTQLPNRNLFYDRLNHSISHALRNASSLSVLIIDLDRFKFINKSLGHHVGDTALRILSDRLQKSLRDEDTVSRLGGDEFGILLEGIDSPRDVVTVVRKLIDVLSAPCHIEGHEVFLTPSIGISLYPDDGNEVRILIQNADTALQRAKEEGKNTYQFYTNEMNTTAMDRLALENNLRYAIQKDQFSVHYQPQVDLATEEIIGLEALLRWDHPVMGAVSPARFIPVAEEVGLIVPIGEWVFRSVCEQIKTWKGLGIEVPRISVNFSASQFQSRTLLDNMVHMLTEYGVSAGDLEVEITESVAMADIEYSVQTLEKMSRMGFHISIDDFGTGYSSLAYLKRFPLNKLKIDRSFVKDIGRHRDNEAIISAVIALGRSLKLKIVAEGVETEEQYDFLNQQKCDLIQGHIYLPPVSVPDITEILMRKEGLERSGH